MHRYVDDFFGIDREGSDEHGKQIFARCGSSFVRCFALAPMCNCRLVKCVLGETAVSQHKLTHGNPEVILGVDVQLIEDGIECKPSKDKRRKWAARIRRALQTQMLHSGEASKLAGAYNTQLATRIAFYCSCQVGYSGALSKLSAV